MKIFAFSLSLIWVLFSCQPKDQFIPQNKDNTKKDSNPALTAMSVEEQNKVLAVTLDKLSESLALVKAAVNEEYSKSLKLNRGVLVENDELTSTTLNFMTLESEDKLSLVKDKFKAEIVISQIIEELQINDSKEIIFLKMKSNTTKPLKNRGLVGETDFASNVTASTILLKKLQNEPRVYILHVTKSEDVNSKRDKQSVMNTQIKVKFSWDGKIESLNQELLISGIVLNVVRTGSKTGELKLKDLNTQLLVNLNSCVSLNGQLSLVPTGSENAQVAIQPIILNLQDSNISVQGTKFVSKSAPCDVRPLVDLTRML